MYSTEQPGANESFCPAVPGIAHYPKQLLARGPVTPLAGADPTWLRVPMPPTSLKAGVYWIGVLFATDATCYSGIAPAGGHPAVGPGATDAYVQRSFDAGPGDGPAMRWQKGKGGFAVFATTRP